MTSPAYSTSATHTGNSVVPFPTSRKRAYPNGRLRKNDTPPQNVRWLHPAPPPVDRLPPSPLFLAVGAMAAAMEPKAFTRLVGNLRARAMDGDHYAHAALIIVTEGAAQ